MENIYNNLTMDNIYNAMFTFLSVMILSRLIYLSVFNNQLITNFIQSFLTNSIPSNKKQYTKRSSGDTIKIAVLTNELPPIIYGGVSTWVVNFLKMFQSHPLYEAIPIFLAYMDDAPESFYDDYPGIRVIKSQEDLKEVFKDIDICVNNLWIANETIIDIKYIYPDIPIITVCHSLIKMEHITNMGSQYTNNFPEQEKAFALSDFVVLISHAEEKYYKHFNYHTKYKATPRVIYNMYSPKYDDDVKKPNIDYSNNTIGYIGRHVPRKRPELPIMAVTNVLKDKNLMVYNMGVDPNNAYWQKLHKSYGEQMNIIHFTPDKKYIQKFWNNVGVNCITGIYEPFGYTICETLDRGVPAIVQNLDGPKEIIEEVKDCVFMYDVDKDIKKDIANFSEALKEFLETPANVRESMAKRARTALNKLHPTVIQKEWVGLFESIIC
jgi:glycosyltransferase involved in cell wall biosynthesis